MGSAGPMYGFTTTRTYRSGGDTILALDGNEAAILAKNWESAGFKVDQRIIPPAQAFDLATKFGYPGLAITTIPATAAPPMAIGMMGSSACGLTFSFTSYPAICVFPRGAPVTVST